MEAKPIFIIRLPHSHIDNFEKFDDKGFTGFVEDMKVSFPDYHVLVIGEEIEKVAFEAFYPKDFGGIEIGEMQKQVLESITNRNG